ncbi:MAG: hypothetical protein J0M12_14450 [Deltaproteobacteria bacterium]|nr:hypothetical protein [Deltaproteobacteria bacterium]
MKKLYYLSRDFFRIVSGRSYFHQQQLLGLYFGDPRGYYNDMRGKANWDGARISGLPALFVPALETHVLFPIMVLQYGLGSLDMYFQTGDARYLQAARQVARWVLEQIEERGSFRNYFVELDPATPHYSDNSCMSAGEAISLLGRISSEQLDAPSEVDRYSSAMRKLAESIVAPVGEGGCAVFDQADVSLCETCERSGRIIFNGWIFGIFGLFDYRRFSNDASFDSVLQSTVSTLRRRLPAFTEVSGWGYYDTHKRLNSPFYQELSIYLFEAMGRLFGEPEFLRMADHARSGFSLPRRIKYTLVKVKDKLFDQALYATKES